MKLIKLLLLIMCVSCTTLQSAGAFTFNVGEDWTQSSKNFSTSGTLASGTQTIIGNSTMSGSLTVGGEDIITKIEAVSGDETYINSNYASLAAALLVIGTNVEATLNMCDTEIIPDGITVTVPDNVTLDFNCGGDIVGTAGGSSETLVVNGNIISRLDGTVIDTTNLTFTDNSVGGGYVISAESVVTLRLYDYGTYANNTIWGVKAKGLYYWDETSSDADDGDDFLVPTGSATNGRWVKMALTAPASSGFTGDLVGDVTGDVTGNADTSTTTTGAFSTQNDDLITGGYLAANATTTETDVLAIGQNALLLSTANSVMAIGNESLTDNTTGVQNTGIGHNTLADNTEGHDNVALGHAALTNNTTGDYNTAIGVAAQINGAGQDYNTLVGYAATNVITGSYGVAIGASSDATGDNSIAIGYATTSPGANKVRIGNASIDYIGGEVGWTTISDRRHKFDIVPLIYGLDAVLDLYPVMFKRISGDGRDNFGFIAQDIEELFGIDYNILSISHNEERTLGIRTEDIIPLLVNAIKELNNRILELESL